MVIMFILVVRKELKGLEDGSQLYKNRGGSVIENGETYN